MVILGVISLIENSDVNNDVELSAQACDNCDSNCDCYDCISPD